MASYDVGDLAACTVTFADSDGDPADPSTVRFKVRRPDGTTSTWTHGVDSEVVKTAVGAYRVHLDLTGSGIWGFRFEGTGSIQAAVEGSLQVNGSAFA